MSTIRRFADIRTSWLFIATAAALLMSAPASGQDDAAGEHPQQISAAKPFSATTLAERFNATLETVNGAIATAMFFDIAFGAFHTEEKDIFGQVVYKQEPVLFTVDEEMRGYQLTKDGDLATDEDGKRVIVTLSPGDQVQRVNAQGEPATTKGDAKMTGPELPFTVLFLAGGAVFFTFWYGWINIRSFKHAIDIVRGKFASANDPGEVSPFRALTSALSATVGLGNIAGVAIAIKVGGPGAIFWMMFLGLFGMTAKFHESTLGQMYRRQNPDGSVSGGPMYYLDAALANMGSAAGYFGKVLAIMFAVFCIGGALGGGNMFQANQSFEGFYSAFVSQPSIAEQARQQMTTDELRTLLTQSQLAAAMTDSQSKTLSTVSRDQADALLEEVRRNLSDDLVRGLIKPSQVEATLPLDQVKADTQSRKKLKRNVSYGFGLLMATLVAVVVIGGITRIGAATSKIVPTMCLLYVIGCLMVIAVNIKQIPDHIELIFQEAFRWDSAYGGLIGVMIMGFKRAAFSSEAGLGSSAIAHSAAKQAFPVREGFVASLEPFIDTIVICFMTSMVVLITDAYIAPELLDEKNGTAVTLYAFRQTPLGTWFPYVLSVSVVLFAFSTMISWCYYGERAYGYLFGHQTLLIFRIVFVACVFVGSVASLGPVLDFSDLMILSMAFPNILGGIFLVGLVRRSLREYWANPANRRTQP